MPVAQVADRFELPPAQIVAGLAVAAVGAVGIPIIVTVAGTEALLQVPFTQVA